VKVVWLSAGVSSFIAGYLAKNVGKYIYIDIKDQHPDSMRFIKDCQKVLDREIEILKSSEFDDVASVVRKFKFINSPHGAACTGMLKRKVRKHWESDHVNEQLTYVWGFDKNETNRAERLQKTMFEFKHEFPLIDKNLSKEECHGMLERLGIKRPVMYDLGYSNNNCVGCVKGGMGYWNKIRVDFPEVFNQRAKLEREIGHSCLKECFLDELDPNRGKDSIVIPDCGIMCELAILEN
jgi:hypothetical protein